MFPRVGDLTLHRDERRVERNGRRIDLTPREYAMLDFLMCNAGRPVSRSKIFEEVWHMRHDPSTNIVDVYMKYVRDKVDLPEESKLIIPFGESAMFSALSKDRQLFRCFPRTCERGEIFARCNHR